MARFRSVDFYPFEGFPDRMWGHVPESPGDPRANAFLRAARPVVARARLALDVVDTEVRELARLRGWNPDVFDVCRDHVIARDYVYAWDGAWKTSPDRRQ